MSKEHSILEPKLLLDVVDLQVRFKSEQDWVTAVKNLSFRLYKGQTLGIVGESGSGKSVSCLSILKLLNAQQSQVSGQVHYHKKETESIDLLTLEMKELRRFRGAEIAMIFQEPMTSLNPVYTCGEQVTEAIRLHQKVGKKQAFDLTLNLFEEVQLPDPRRAFHAYPHQLSGGQKQRVMIAMALSCSPKILIADEPTTALDVTVQKTILDLLKKLQQERGMSMIFISHDLGIISEIADEMLVMYRGDLVERGNAVSVFNSPQHAYTKGLLACRPAENQGLHRLPVIADFMKTNAEGLIVESHRSMEEVRASYSYASGEKERREKIMYSANPILLVEKLSKWYPVGGSFFRKPSQFVKAVDDVSFNVYPGETLGLVGESGCGKTTLGRTLLRLIEPSHGEIFYRENNLRKMASVEMRAMRKRMQIIFQDPYSSLNAKQTVGETIIEPMRVHELFQTESQRKKRAIELLERVNMNASHFNRYPHEFSGGQRQRIGIARTLALEPEFIICDESVSALDVSVQAQIINLLISLREEFNLTYIFISHDLSVVQFIADRLLVMHKGRIVEEGKPIDIYSNPQKEYTRKLIDAIPQGRRL